MKRFYHPFVVLGFVSTIFSGSVFSEPRVAEHDKHQKLQLEYEAFKQQKADEIQAVINYHTDHELPLADANYSYVVPHKSETLEYPLIFEVVMFGTPAQLNTLIAAGADVNALFPGEIPRTPIYFSNNTNRTPNGWLECRPEQAKQLLSAGATLDLEQISSISNRVNLLGDLTVSDMPGCPEILSLLIENGADVNVQDMYGRTPLSDALLFNGINAVETLLAAGADPTLKDITGLSVFEYALQMTLPYLPVEDSIDSQANTIRRFIELAINDKQEAYFELSGQQQEAEDQ